MDKDYKGQILTLVVSSIIALFALLIVWEFWVESLFLSAYFGEKTSKTLFEKWEFIIVCLFFICLAIAPLIKITMNALFDLKWANKMLKITKDREQKLAQVDKLITLVIDKNGAISKINPRGCQITGLKKEQITGKNFIDICIPAKSKGQILKAFELLFDKTAKTHTRQYKTSLKTKLEEEKIVDWVTSRLLDENGEIYALLTSGQDVTDKYRLEQKIQADNIRHDSEMENIAADLQQSRENYKNAILRSEKLIIKFELRASLGKIFSNITAPTETNKEESDQNIWLALKYFGEYSGASHGYISLFVDQGANMINTHLWGPDPDEDPPNPEDKIPLEIFPWFKAKIMNQEIIHCPDTSQLPPEAEKEKSVFESQNIRSIINIPLIFNGTTMGYLCFESEELNQNWDEDDVSTLKLMSEFFIKTIHHPELTQGDAVEVLVEDNEEENYKQLVEGEITKAKEPLTKQLQDVAGELDKLRAELDIANNKGNQSKENLQEAEIELIQKTLEIESIEKDRTNQYEAALEEKRKVERELEDSRQSMQKKIDAAIEDLENLRNSVQSGSSETIRLEEALEEANTALAETRSIHATLESKYSDLRGKIEQSKETEQQLQKAKNTIERQADELHVFDAKYVHIQSNVDLLNETQAQLDATRDSLKKQTEGLKALNEKLNITEADNAKLNSETQKLKLDQLEHDNTRKLLETLRQEYEDKQLALTLLKDEFTERDEKFSQSEKNYQAITEKSGLIFVNLSDDYQVVDFSKEAQTVFGWERKDIINKDFFASVLPENMREHIKTDATACLESKSEADFEGPIASADNTSRTFSWSLMQEVNTSGQPASLIAMGQDITQLRETENTLRQQEGLLNSAVDNAVDGFITIDENGILQTVNPAAENLFGYAASEIIGQNVSILMPDPYRKEHDNYISNYTLTGQARMVGKPPREFLGLRKDGSVFPIEIAIRETQQDYRRMFVGIVRDISKRKHIEQTLKESEDKFRQLLAAESDAILILNASNNRILDANDSALALLGYSREELLKLKSGDVTTDVERPLPSGNGNSLKQITRKALQYYKKMDGTVFPAQSSTTAFMSQNHKLYFRIIRDISDQTRMEENVKGSKQHLQTIINNFPEAVYLKDAQGKYLLVNQKFESLFNVSLQQIKGKTDIEVFPKDLAENFKLSEANVLESGNTVETQQTILHDDGAHIYHAIKFPLKHSPSEVANGLCGILRDITQNTKLSKDLKNYKDRLEQMVDQRTADLVYSQKKFVRSEKLSATNKLAGTVSTHINNSIFGIRNILEQINDRASLEAIHKDLVTLGVKECNRVETFIKKLQISHAPEPGTTGPVDIHQIIEEIIDATKENMQAKNITLEKHLASDMPKITGVSAQIKQVIQNIVQNAQESLPKDKGKILIATDWEGENIKITVQDTGCGIPPENLTAIFDPFFTTKSAIKRSGLGLLLSLGIVKGHEGDIDVDSKPGSGTTFTITLPVERLKNK